MISSKHLLIFFLLFSTLTNAQVNGKIYTKYDTTLTPHDNYVSGFANIFQEYGDNFRIRMLPINTENPMILEKLSNSKWAFVDSFDFSYSFSHSIADDIKEDDFTNDGVKDFLIQYGKWSDIKLVFMYDTASKNLFRVGYFTDKPLQVKGYKNLFYDNWSGKWSSWSYLYTIRNNERVNLAIAELKVKLTFKNIETIPVPKYISIRKLTNAEDIEITKIERSQFRGYSDEAFWIKNANLFYNKESNNIRSQKNDYPENFGP